MGKPPSEFVRACAVAAGLWLGVVVVALGGREPSPSGNLVSATLHSETALVPTPRPPLVGGGGPPEATGQPTPEPREPATAQATNALTATSTAQPEPTARLPPPPVDLQTPAEVRPARAMPSGAAGVWVTEATFRAALAASSWEAWTHETVVAIALCESGDRLLRVIRLDSVGALGERGPMQVHPGAHPEYASWDLYDLATNLEAGHGVFVKAGRSFGPWRGCQ